MSGILAVLGVPMGAETIRPKVDVLLNKIKHRGPDGCGLYCSGRNLLAHQHLKIIGVDQSGEQPLVPANSKVIVSVSGEIYNYLHLREQLGNSMDFRTNSSCEIIRNLYEHYHHTLHANFIKNKNSYNSNINLTPEILIGITDDDDNIGEVQYTIGVLCKWLNMLNGIFAFVCLDESDNSFIIARDHVGVIPLYIGYDTNKSLWVASELKAIIETCSNSIIEFPPGHVYSSKFPRRLVQWYHPKWMSLSYYNFPLIQNKREHQEEIQKHLIILKQKLEEAVSRQLMSNVPFGVLLSGGLDSSIIAAIVSSKITNGTFSGRIKFKTFSVGLMDSPDLPKAKLVAEAIGSEHHEVKFTVEEALEVLPKVIYYLETYDVTTIRAATPMFLLCKYMKEYGIKMVLTGEGADEIFGGYLYFHYCPSREEFHRETVHKVQSLHKYDFLRANKVASAWGIEIRVPFHDREVLDYVMGYIDPIDRMCGRIADIWNIDSQLGNEEDKIRVECSDSKIEKWILRKAFNCYPIPNTVLWRQKEQFSDGVGYQWISEIQKFVQNEISDEDMMNAHITFSYNTPKTKEAYYYRSIFHTHFPHPSACLYVPSGPSIACSTPAAISWDSSFSLLADCSGRSVAGIHKNAYDDHERTRIAELGAIP